jgi:hypothetical protein
MGGSDSERHMYTVEDVHMYIYTFLGVSVTEVISQLAEI